MSGVYQVALIQACMLLRYIFKLDAARALVQAEVEKRLAPLDARQIH